MSELYRRCDCESWCESRAKYVIRVFPEDKLPAYSCESHLGDVMIQEAGAFPSTVSFDEIVREGISEPERTERCDGSGWIPVSEGHGYKGFAKCKGWRPRGACKLHSPACSQGTEAK